MRTKCKVKVVLNAFPRILNSLRKERGVSQKEAAKNLGVSQALLSHYEKGIRECGLDFVVRAADYYGVSCDYLLGRTPDKTGAILTVEDIPESGSEEEERTDVLAVLNKKLVLNSVHILFDLLQKCNHKQLTVEASAFLNMAVYTLFRQLYQANAKNPKTMFSVPTYLYMPLTSGCMEVAAAKFGRLANGHYVDGIEGLSDAPLILADELSKEYPLFASSLLNLLKNAETRIL